MCRTRIRYTWPPGRCDKPYPGPPSKSKKSWCQGWGPGMFSSPSGNLKTAFLKCSDTSQYKKKHKTLISNMARMRSGRWIYTLDTTEMTRGPHTTPGSLKSLDTTTFRVSTLQSDSWSPHPWSPPEPTGAQPWKQDQTRSATDQTPAFLAGHRKDQGKPAHFTGIKHCLSGICAALLNPEFCVSDGRMRGHGRCPSSD